MSDTDKQAKMWDYKAEKEKRPCAICGGPVSTTGMTLPLCDHPCEVEWLASAERTERATARQRFIDRMKKARGAGKGP
jgi:endogenous inhibitor of DNA gyrase (YacG/DUF329 family)